MTSAAVNGQDRPHRRRSIRLKEYDYRTSGAYFVTMCAYERACLFGEVVNGVMRLNRLGCVVSEEWRRTPDLRSNVELDAFVVMPNHLHAILLLHEESTPSDGGVGANRWFAPRLGGRPALETQSNSGLVANSLGAIIGQFKSVVTKRIGAFPDGSGRTPIWQRNYWEHIIRTDAELDRVRQYILDNPARWTEDEYNPSVFGRGAS